MLQKPFYDPQKSYEENYENGPFGVFQNKKLYKNSSPPKYNFHGYRVNLPFGIPAGPLLNSKFVKGAFEKGFDIAVYKTIRTRFFPCHPFPNILSLSLTENLTLKRAKTPLIATSDYGEPLSITNSFGVPSKDPSLWQEDVEKAVSYAQEGQILVLSFMGTIKKDQTPKEFLEDFSLAAKLSNETNAKILEANLSCPNIGNEGLVCYDLNMTRKITEKIRRKIGNKPLILKVGYYQNNSDLEELARIAHDYSVSIASINTIPGIIVNKNGSQALPGNVARLRSGVCGSAIKWAGIDQVKRLKTIREKNDYKFFIEGVGGVMNPDDYHAYKNTGADSVMSATGSMWNPLLAQEIKETL